MQQKVTPVMVIVAVVILVLLVAAIAYFTMGKKKGAADGLPPNGGTMQPTNPEDAAKMGIEKGTGVAPATP